MLHDLVLDRGVVSVLGIILDFSVYIRILGEHLTHQELLGECESFYLCRGHMHELCLGVVAQVVVSEERVGA